MLAEKVCEKPSLRHCEPFGYAQDKLREAI